MGIVPPRPLQPMVDECDDYRPRSSWTFAVDPDNRVDIGIIHEVMAVGDRIPLHEHSIDEVLLIVEGSARVRLADEAEDVTTGATVFIPAGTPHGTTNIGDTELRLVAIFPSTLVDMHLFERNPEPGTEDRAPVRNDWNMRTGEVRILDDDGHPTGDVLRSAAAG